MSVRRILLSLAVALLAAIGCAGREASAANYAIHADAPKVARVGQSVTVVLRVTPQSGWKVNTRYPIRLKLQPVAGVELARTSFAKGDARVDEHEARFDVPVTIKEAGAKTVTGELKFSVCAADKCDIKKETVSWKLSAR
jgi:hypothetical protein